MSGLVQHEYRGQSELSRPDWPSKHDIHSRTMDLGKYTVEPKKHKHRVLRETKDTVLILDKYPKSKVHLLMLPRWTPHQDLHPHDALADPVFLKVMREEATTCLSIAAARLEELVRKENLLHPGGKQLNEGLENRDFTKDFKIGIHAHPSMHHLHVHIISMDMASAINYSGRHYSSFNTDFIVPLRDYPLSMDDQRRKASVQNANLLKETFQCWRCGRDYGGDWPSLKTHLFLEWESWCCEERNDKER